MFWLIQMLKTWGGYYHLLWKMQKLKTIKGWVVWRWWKNMHKCHKIGWVGHFSAFADFFSIRSANFFLTPPCSKWTKNTKYFLQLSLNWANFHQTCSFQLDLSNLSHFKGLPLVFFKKIIFFWWVWVKFACFSLKCDFWKITKILSHPQHFMH